MRFTKTEKTQIHFLSDLFVAVMTLLDLKVAAAEEGINFLKETTDHSAMKEHLAHEPSLICPSIHEAERPFMNESR